jgi:hypothetical protein
MSTTAHLQPRWSHQVIATPTTGTQGTPTCSANKSGGNTYMTCNIGNFSYIIEPMANRCNGTHYWAIQAPKEIIPDHGTIFTDRLIAFWMPFISSTV